VWAQNAISQVSSLAWHPMQQHLVSAHGYDDNNIVVWDAASYIHGLSKLRTLYGHTSRVLHACISPCGSSIASVSGDETLRLWRVWKDNQSAGARRAVRRDTMMNACVR